MNRGTLFVFVLAAALTVVVGAGTVAGQSAPDCSQVSYEGEGTEQNPYEVGNVDQLQCIEDQDSANYIQVADIDASSTAEWNSVFGFDPIGDNTDFFGGTFDGAGHTISGLTIDRGSSDVGLFGHMASDAHIENVALENVDIKGDGRVGALVGEIGYGTVEDSYATGSVSGSSVVGGLVGTNRDSGNVRGSYANVEVSASGDSVGGPVGGLLGANENTIENSYATGSVSGAFEVGGIVGRNDGPVTDSYATGSVSGDEDVGGLVGQNDFDGKVKTSYATGSVSGNNSVGGLLGTNANIIESSYATGSVSGDEYVGGLVGRNRFEDVVTDSYATGSVSGDEDVGGFIGYNKGIVENAYATGSVSGDQDMGGFVGRGIDDSTVTESYWDIEATGQSTSDGGTGLTTSEMTGSAATSNMQGFDFTDIWNTVTAPDDYPVLVWQIGDEPDPANFDISIATTNSPVQEGNTLTVDATVTNTGGQSDSQTIDLSVGSLGSDSKPVSLDGGGSDTVTLSVRTSSGDAGTYTATVSSDDDTASTTMEVTSGGGSGGEFTSPVSGVSDELWTEVTGDGTLSLGDLGTAIQEYQDNGEVNGVNISLGDLGSLIQEYQS